MEKRKGERRGARNGLSIDRSIRALESARGRAPRALLLLILALGGSAAWWSISRRESKVDLAHPTASQSPAEPAEAASRPDDDHGAREPVDPRNLGPLFAHGRSPLVRERPPGPPPASRFEGTGTLRGRISTDPPNAPFPQQWTLELAPSRSLIGSGREATRTLAFRSGEREFELTDLPLGGYELRFDLGDLDAPARPVLLALPDTADIVLNVVAHPGGALEGRCVDPAGLALEGLGLVLERIGSGERANATTDAGGRFRFEPVHDGEYQLFFGDPQSPIVPPRQISFRAPRLTLAAVELPALGGLDLTVLDAQGLPVAGAKIGGWGDKGGAFTAVSDVDGRASARCLPPGSFSLVVEHPESGRGKEHSDVRASETAAVTVRLHK